MAEIHNYNHIDIDNHNWLSNPLDWRPIDRVIVLAFFIYLIPFFYVVAIFAAHTLAPTWLNPVYEFWLSVYMAVLFLSLSGLLYTAFKIRKERHEWCLLENFVVSSYHITVTLISWVTGTYFTTGLLMFFLGMIIALSLLNIKTLKIGYAAILICLLAFFFIEVSGKFEYAPILIVNTYDENGAPLFLWTVFQGTIALILSSLLYISLLMTERWWRREEQLIEYAHNDPLTGLTNRRQLMVQAEVEVIRTKRGRSKLLSVIILDIDSFKNFNDTYGHQAGDAVIVHIANILSENAREYDIVSRYGGEEFVLILPETSQEDALQIAERLRTIIASSPLNYEGTDLKVTSSFGVSSFKDTTNHNLHSLLKAADNALYQAKENGRNRVEISINN